MKKMSGNAAVSRAGSVSQVALGPPTFGIANWDNVASFGASGAEVRAEFVAGNTAPLCTQGCLQNATIAW